MQFLLKHLYTWTHDKIERTNSIPLNIIKHNYNLILQLINTVTYLANFIFWYFIWFQMPHGKKFERYWTILKVTNQTWQWICGIYFNSFTIEGGTTNQTTFNIVIVFLWDVWLTISPQTLIDYQAETSNELQNYTTFAHI